MIILMIIEREILFIIIPNYLLFFGGFKESIMMHKNFLLLLAILLSSTRLFSQSFDNLATFQVNENIVIRYNAALSKVINKKKDADYTIINTIETSISGKPNEKVIILYDAGASDDPSFCVVKTIDGESSECLGGTELIIPGNGYVYVSGHSNTMFNAHRKFFWQNNKLVEVKQPFYYVGLQSETLRDVKLCRDTDYKSVVAALPAGYKVEVLINKGDNYLVKTPNGLVGWLKIIDGMLQDESPLKGIFFAGD